MLQHSEMKHSGKKNVMFTIPHNDANWNAIAVAAQIHAFHSFTATHVFAAAILHSADHSARHLVRGRTVSSQMKKLW